jgi:membrane-associated phospholipid phosphatase
MFMLIGYLAPRLRLNPGQLDTPDFPALGAATLGLAAAVAVDLLLLAACALYDRAERQAADDRSDHGAAGRLVVDERALVPPVLRPFCWLVILPSLAGVAVLASRVAGTRGPLRVDARVDGPLAYRLSGFRPLFEGLTQLGGPGGVAVLSALLGLGCLAARRRRAAVLALVGPPAAGVLTEYALKPLIGRRSGHVFAFPSGHTTGAVAVAAVIALLLLPSGPFAGLPGQVRGALGVFAAGLASIVPLGLIVLRYHYATDVLAGGAIAIAAVLALALGLDAGARRWTRTRADIPVLAGTGPGRVPPE